MARNETDREDLMREATALVKRAELRVDGEDDVITVGFRRQHGLSVFFEQDPVYQFDSSGRLRRAFVGGRVYRSQHTTLAEMTRVRSETQTVLSRVDLVGEELAGFRAAMHDRLTVLWSRLKSGAIQVDRIVDPDGDMLTLLAIALETILQRTDDWLSAEIRRRR